MPSISRSCRTASTVERRRRDAASRRTLSPVECRSVGHPAFGRRKAEAAEEVQLFGSSDLPRRLYIRRLYIVVADIEADEEVGGCGRGGAKLLLKYNVVADEVLSSC